MSCIKDREIPEKTGFCDRRIIDDREESSRVRHESPTEERLVVVQQVDKIDEAIKIGVLVAELHHHAA